MTMIKTNFAKTSGSKDRIPQSDGTSERLLDRELADLPADLRWREWIMRVEVVIFASAVLVGREVLARVVGKDCSIDLLMDDLVEELDDRPHDLVPVARRLAAPEPFVLCRCYSGIAGTDAGRGGAATLSEFEATVLMSIAYFQPLTRSELSKIFGKEVSRDVIGSLRGAGFIASGPRSPTPGAPYTYVTTKQFLSAFGMQTLRGLPDIDALENAGLRSAQTPAGG